MTVAHDKSAKFDGHRQCGSGDIVFFLVPEEEDSRCSHFNLPLLLIFGGYGLKANGISY